MTIPFHANGLDAASALPVLARTVYELHRCSADEDIGSNEIADVVLHDPFMVLKTLLTVNAMAKGRLSTEITTVTHAIMRMGSRPFFSTFNELTTLEDKLGSHPQSLSLCLDLISRLEHAAYLAHAFAIERKDIESEELYVATLLRGCTELLLWSVYPEPMLDYYKRRTGHLRPDTDLQQEILGFTLGAFSQACFDAWAFPSMLRLLMSNDLTKARVPPSALAFRIAELAEKGWFGEAIVETERDVAAMLRLPFDDTVHLIHQTAVSVARSWEWYGCRPAAALLVEA